MIELVNLEEEGKGRVMAHENDGRMLTHIRDNLLGHGKQVVEADDFMSLVQKSIDQMGARKPGTAGHKDPFPTIV